MYAALATSSYSDVSNNQAYSEPDRIASLTLVSTAAELKNTIVYVLAAVSYKFLLKMLLGIYREPPQSH